MWQGKPALRALLPLLVAVIIMLIGAIIILKTMESASVDSIVATVPMVLIGALLVLVGFRFMRSLARTSVDPKSVMRSRGMGYVVTNQRVVLQGGILKRYLFEEDLSRFHRTLMNQSTWQTILRIGDVSLEGGRKDGSQDLTALLSIPNPVQAKEMIRQAIIERRKAVGVSVIDVI